MAAKNQDGGQKFSILQTKKFSMVLKNHHAKYGACCHSVTGHSTTAYTKNHDIPGKFIYFANLLFFIAFSSRYSCDGLDR